MFFYNNSLHLSIFSSEFFLFSKDRFGGEIYHQLGYRDYPIDMDKYRYIAAREMAAPGYYS